jgi:hypothetical protein
MICHSSRKIAYTSKVIGQGAAGVGSGTRIAVPAPPHDAT